MQVDERLVAGVVLRVMEQVEKRLGRGIPGVGGIFERLDDAVMAAGIAQGQLSMLSREKRSEIIDAMRQVSVKNAALLAEMAVKESGLGRVEDKVAKNRLAALKTPGLEDLDTAALSGDHGLTIEELAPMGVIGSITPITNPAATVINNAISMLAAGNAVVFCPHPAAKLTSCKTVEVLNQAILEVGGPANLLTSVSQPDVDVAKALMHHPRIDMLSVTGGSAVVSQALASGKRAIGAAAGNPPAVIDETCDVRKAGHDVVLGAGLDNNLPCISEKAIVVVDKVAATFMEAMEAGGARRLTPAEAKAVTQCILAHKEGKDVLGASGPAEVLGKVAVRKDYVGRRAEVILQAAGVSISGDPRIAFMEVDQGHPLVWLEQMLPIIPVVRVADVDEAIRTGVAVEGGHRHTAVIWSRNVDTMTRLARLIKTTVFVKNGPSYAGIGLGGEGHTAFTIAGATGEGLTSARTFTRRRRCILVDAFSIV
ncbi:MAG TPA: aldehyde dehydrogenase family protein [Symbiobacteriaceae bacterium]|nr:aldehyde dehydrogenase family protein [Symbiobacteriaceae bacterium]